MADEVFARCLAGNALHLARDTDHTLCGQTIFDCASADDVTEDERLCLRCFADPADREMAEALLAGASPKDTSAP